MVGEEHVVESDEVWFAAPAGYGFGFDGSGRPTCAECLYLLFLAAFAGGLAVVDSDLSGLWLFLVGQDLHDELFVGFDGEVLSCALVGLVPIQTFFDDLAVDVSAADDDADAVVFVGVGPGPAVAGGRDAHGDAVFGLVDVVVGVGIRPGRDGGWRIEI